MINNLVKYKKENRQIGLDCISGSVDGMLIITADICYKIYRGNIFYNSEIQGNHKEQKLICCF